MTAPTVAPDPTRCPDCHAPLPGTGACAACGLPLTGPVANRLWEVECELLSLEHARQELLDERHGLIATLRSEDGRQPQRQPQPRTAGSPVPLEPSVPRREWTPQRVQNLLLTLGGLLLAVAAVVFTAVTYERLGAAGRAAVLVLLTLAAGAAAPRLRTRGLSATSETVGAVALVLAALDAYGLRTLGLAQDTHGLSYAAGAATALAALAGVYAHVVPLRVLQVSAVALAQLPVPLLLVRSEASPATAGLALAALAGLDLAVLAVDARRRPLLPAVARTALWIAVALVTALALQVSVAASTLDEPRLGAGALVAVAAVLTLAGVLVQAPVWRALLTGAAVPTLAAAAHALAPDELTAVLVLAAAGLLAVLTAVLLPAAWRPGPVLGGLAVSAAALAQVAEPVVGGVLLPLTWLADPWSLPAGRSARNALPPGLVWTGTVAPVVALAAAALSTAAAGIALQRTRLAVVPVGVLATATAGLLPLALDLPYAAALALLLVVGGVLVGAGVLLAERATTGGSVLAAAGAAVVLLAVAWATASQGATLLVLPVAALLAGAAATRDLPLRSAAVAASGLLATAELGAAGAASGLAADQVGGLLLVAVGALLAAAALLDRSRRPGAETAAALAAVAAVTLAVNDVGWLSWTLAGAGLLALATALRPDRRVLARAGALLLASSSWVRLADAGVEAPEPYVLPVAAVALVLGHLRRRSAPGTASWAAYGPALVLALVPSLVAAAGDEGLARPLLLGLAAAGVVLAGARSRLRAPLAVGGIVLAADALLLLGPYAAALPRWLSLGTVGVLLLVVGATYEQRRADVARLRHRFDALA